MALKELRGLCLLLLVRQFAALSIYKPGNITIGALFPLHGTTEEKVCNKLRPYGLGFVEALIYCIDQINKNKEILPGITLGYDIRDYCESPTLGMKITHEFVKQNFIYDFDVGACGNRSAHIMSTSRNARRTSSIKSPISTVIGAHDSGTTVLIAELLGVVNIPLISPFSTSEQLSSYPTFFRTIPPDGLQARAMVDLIAEFNWSYVGIAAVDHSYGRYGVRHLEKEALKRNKFCAGTVEYFPRLGYQTKMESIINKFLRQKLVRVIVLWANSGQTVDFLKKALEMGLHDKVWILSDDVSALSSSAFQGITDKMNGVFLGIAHRYYHDVAMEDHFKNLLAKPKMHIWWNEFFQQEFNCTLRGFKSSGIPHCSNRPYRNVSSALSKLYTPYTPYLTDAVKAIGKALHAIYNCNNKIQNCPKTKPYINPTDLLEYLKNVSFQGITGKVGFDQQGNPISNSYDIIHLHNDSTNVCIKTKIGSWSTRNGLQINKNLIKWTVPEKGPPSSVCLNKCFPGTWQTQIKNCCWECIPCKDGTVSIGYAATECKKCGELMVANKNKTTCLEEVVINITLASKTGIVFTIISGLGILLSVNSLLLFLKYHATPLVKASNRELSFVLLVNIIFGFVIAILHVSFPTEAICSLNTLLRYPIHCICISILFIKTIRIAGAFQLEIVGIPKCCKRFVVNSKLQFIMLIVLNTCPVTLALLWKFLDHPYVIVKKAETPRTIAVEYFCKPYRGDTGLGLQLCSLFYLILMTLMCIFYSFKARSLPGNFNETRYIGLSLYILLVSWLAYYPINSALKGWYVGVISSATSLLASYGILVCIFLPKFYIILLHPNRNTNEAVRAELRNANRGANSISAQSQ